MEQSGTTTGCNIKRRSLDEYWRETKNIMIHLGFKNLLFNDENIGQCASALMAAEISYNLKIGELSTWKFKHVQNECRELLKRQKTKKRKLLNNSLSVNSVFDKASAKFSYREVSPEILADANSIVNYIENTKFLTNNQKKCFLSYYLLGMSQSDISEELNISRVRVGQILAKAISILKFKYGKDIDKLYG